MSNPNDKLTQLRERCRAFRADLAPEDQAAFDALLREAARNIQAGVLDEDLLPGEVLMFSLAIANQRRLDEVEGRLKAIDERLKALEG